jgi:hypothetical protein
MRRVALAEVGPSKQERFLEQQAQALARIVGVVGHAGCASRKSGKEPLWTASVSLPAWRSGCG